MDRMLRTSFIRSTASIVSIYTSHLSRTSRASLPTAVLCLQAQHSYFNLLGTRGKNSRMDLQMGKQMGEYLPGSSRN